MWRTKTWSPPWGKIRTYYPSCQLPCSLPSLLSFSGSNEVSLAVSWLVHAHKALPGRLAVCCPPWLSYKPDSLPLLRGVWLVQLVLLCFASRGSCSVQEGCELPVIALSSTSLCTPILAFNVYVTVETGKKYQMCAVWCIISPCPPSPFLF